MYCDDTMTHACNSAGHAVSLPPPSCSSLLRRAFQREMDILSCLSHPNVLRFIAAATDPPPPRLVTELLPMVGEAKRQAGRQAGRRVGRWLAHCS